MLVNSRGEITKRRIVFNPYSANHNYILSFVVVVLFCFFSEKLRLHGPCESSAFALADDSHEISNLIFSEK